MKKHRHANEKQKENGNTNTTVSKLHPLHKNNLTPIQSLLVQYRISSNEMNFRHISQQRLFHIYLLVFQDVFLFCAFLKERKKTGMRNWSATIGAASTESKTFAENERRHMLRNAISNPQLEDGSIHVGYPRGNPAGIKPPTQRYKGAAMSPLKHFPIITDAQYDCASSKYSVDHERQTNGHANYCSDRIVRHGAMGSYDYATELAQ